MGEAGVVAATQRRADAATAAQAPLRASDLAWLALLPCAAVVVVAIVLVGPPLGDVLFPSSTVTFWEDATGFPEPTEYARYLIALTAPLGDPREGGRKRL